uniref:Odorant receptor n=1 Tax=Protaetia brevitarsis TaxID=348688 RepID=A0A411HR48_PROBE|nr:odorant receptor [Protaetia brevitarsis]
MMVFRKNVQRMLNRFQLFQDKVHFLNDEAKYAMVLGRLLVSIANLSPMDYNLARMLFLLFTVAVSIIHEITIAVCFASYVRDVDTLTDVLPALSLGIQIVSKGTVLLIKTKQLATLTEVVWNDFWPANIMGHAVEYKISKLSKRILIAFYTELIVTIVYSISTVILPLRRTPKVLFQQASYPLDLSKPLGYSIAFCIQSYMTLYAETATICGYDLMYQAICINCAAQFRLLCVALEYIGTGKEKEILEEIQNAVSDKTKRKSIKDQDANKELLGICVKHHQTLINVGHELNKIFGTGHFLQLCATLTGICTISYRISQTNDYNTIFVGLNYYFGHLCQLFMFCSASHELSFWSTCPSMSVYNSKWYNKGCDKIKKSLQILMIRSQRQMTMNSFGLFELNYVSFLAVMRFSFTLYTFLKTVAD